MTNARPRKKIKRTGDDLLKNRIWNECCDAWESYLKDAKELVPMDEDKVFKALRNWDYQDTDYISDNDLKSFAKRICKTFGQPKDVVSVEDVRRVITEVLAISLTRHISEHGITQGTIKLDIDYVMSKLTSKINKP